jgi:hypothetical protein
MSTAEQLTSPGPCDGCGKYHGNTIACRYAQSIGYHAALLAADLELLAAIRSGCRANASGRDCSDAAVTRGILRKLAMITALVDDIRERELHT